MAICTRCGIEKELTEFVKLRDSRKKYCKVCDAKRAMAYYEANKEIVKAKRRLNRKAYYQENKNDIIKKQRNWQIANPQIVQNNSAKRRAVSKLATPTWANKLYMQDLYANCREAEQLFEQVGVSVKFHVDHIVPLIHTDVCGLHNEFNLQILTAKDNIEKSNMLFNDYNEQHIEHCGMLHPKDLLT
jgi:hypothetical protein